MGRPIGSRNQGFEERRERIAAAVANKFMCPEGAGASLRELADAAGISVATLRHYFTDRDGAIQAAFEFFHREGAPYLAHAATPVLGELDRSLREYVKFFIAGMRGGGVDGMITSGLEAGLHHQDLGPSFVQEVLEPVIQCLESRLQGHVAHGDMERCHVRSAALFLVSPIILALLHQDGLLGAQYRPLDIDAFTGELVTRFVRAYGATA